MIAFYINLCVHTKRTTTKRVKSFRINGDGAREIEFKVTPQLLLPLPNWGSCRYLRCVKDSEDLNRSLFENPIHDKLKPGLGFLKKRPRVSVVEEGGCIDASAKPWNLRTRRAAACREGRTASGFVDTKEEKVVVEEKKKGVKLSVSLLKEEIEEDFVAMLRIRPPRRPKKRARIVQRHLDTIFPGLWLKEVTAEAYVVPDVPESSCF